MSRFMDEKDFAELLAGDSYYGGRWRYYSKAIGILMSKEFETALEIGPGPVKNKRPTLIKNCDIMDLDGGDIIHDARKIPWPIEDKQYDVLIALQVWEHLGPVQIEAFDEARRVSKMTLLSFPLDWKERVHAIPMSDIKKWTRGLEPSVYLWDNEITANKRIMMLFEWERYNA